MLRLRRFLTSRPPRGICKLEVTLVVVILGLTAALAVPGWQREQREKNLRAAGKKGEKAALAN